MTHQRFCCGHCAIVGIVVALMSRLLLSCFGSCGFCFIRLLFLLAFVSFGCYLCVCLLIWLFVCLFFCLVVCLFVCFWILASFLVFLLAVFCFCSFVSFGCCFFWILLILAVACLFVNCCGCCLFVEAIFNFVKAFLFVFRQPKQISIF